MTAPIPRFCAALAGHGRRTAASTARRPSRPARLPRTSSAPSPPASPPRPPATPLGHHGGLDALAAAPPRPPPPAPGRPTYTPPRRYAGRIHPAPRSPAALIASSPWPPRPPSAPPRLPVAPPWLPSRLDRPAVDRLLCGFGLPRPLAGGLGRHWHLDRPAPPRPASAPSRPPAAPLGRLVALPASTALTPRRTSASWLGHRLGPLG